MPAAEASPWYKRIFGRNRGRRVPQQGPDSQKSLQASHPAGAVVEGDAGRAPVSQPDQTPSTQAGRKIPYEELPGEELARQWMAALDTHIIGPNLVNEGDQPKRGAGEAETLLEAALKGAIRPDIFEKLVGMLLPPEDNTSTNTD